MWNGACMNRPTWANSLYELRVYLRDILRLVYVHDRLWSIWLYQELRIPDEYENVLFEEYA